MKISYFVATSLDGFIAREDGDVSWLDDLNIDMTDTGYDIFFASIDGLIMGRNTYDFIFNFGSWPYEDKPSNRLEVIDEVNGTTTASSVKANQTFLFRPCFVFENSSCRGISKSRKMNMVSGSFCNISS